jgi:site-specific recombinase XerD
MHDELFKQPAVIARYQAGPYAESREQFLKQACADGYSPSTLERIAWALLVVAKATHRNGGSISAEQLKNTLFRRIRLRLTGRRPSQHTAAIFLHFGEAWLHCIGALTAAAEAPFRFASELTAFSEYMRVERGLSPVTIATREERMRWFLASLPFQVQSLGEVTLGDIDAFLQSQARRGWSRRSLHALGSSLRCFFRYAAHRAWCGSDLAVGIDLPRLYALEDIPRAPTMNEVDRVLEATGSGDDPVKIRDHAILLLLIHYGLRRGEVERLTLDDVDWTANKIHITRPKLRRPQWYPLSVPVGEAIVRYLQQARPRCSHRALFLTITAPFRPLSGDSISAMVKRRLTNQGVKLNRLGAHCLRHACASQLLDAGFTLKQIADHLGHRSMNSTRIYTKIDLHGLRQVAEFDLGALL